MTGSGSWIIWSRHDFDSTMYKALLWSRLAGRYDEVAFLDVDIMFRSKPDRLFEALAPNNSSRSGARRRGWQWWRWSKKKWNSGCWEGHSAHRAAEAAMRPPRLRRDEIGSLGYHEPLVPPG